MNAAWYEDGGLHSMNARNAFTLVELLIVVGLIGALSAFLLGGLGGGGKSAAQQSAQSALIGIITVARTKALSTGQPSRVVVNIDATSSAVPARFLRYIAVQTQASAAWQTIMETYLPSGVYVVPGDFTSLPANLFLEDSGAWVRVDGSTPMRSTVLRSTQITTETINFGSAEKWVSFTIGAVGTTAQSGDLMLALGRERVPGSFTEGDSPVQLFNRENVRGVSLSSYGLTVSIDGRQSF